MLSEDINDGLPLENEKKLGEMPSPISVPSNSYYCRIEE